MGFFMKYKSEIRPLLKNFVTFVHTQFNCSIKCIRSDNGPEFSMHEFYNENAIIHQTSRVETPEQNFVVERKHKHILNVTWSLLFHSCFASFLLVLCS
jgi:hypothetical protein